MGEMWLPGMEAKPCLGVPVPTLPLGCARPTGAPQAGDPLPSPGIFPHASAGDRDWDPTGNPLPGNQLGALPARLRASPGLVPGTCVAGGPHAVPALAAWSPPSGIPGAAAWGTAR